MKEHPDYKYRPRRKPKTLQKSSLQCGSSNNHGKSVDLDNSNVDAHMTNVTHHHALSQSSHAHHMEAHHAAAAAVAHHNHHQHAMAVAAAAVASQQHQQLQQQQARSPKLSNKYGFGSSLETLALKMPLHARVPSTTFPGLSHYPLDPTLALDLQTRLQAMYAGSFYHPWRYFGCTPLISPDIPTVNVASLAGPHSPPSPPSSSNGTGSISSTPTLMPLNPVTVTLGTTTNTQVPNPPNII